MTRLPIPSPASQVSAALEEDNTGQKEKPVLAPTLRESLEILDSQPSEEARHHLLSVSDIHQRDQYGTTLVDLAVYNHKPHLIGPLAEAGAAVRYANLQYAVEMGHSDSVVALIARGVATHTKEGEERANNNDLLQKAIFIGNFPMVELLLAESKKGNLTIEINHKNKDGKSLLEEVETKIRLSYDATPYHPIRALLREYGAQTEKELKREQKAATVAKGVLSSLPQEKPTAPEVIASVFFPGRGDVADFFTDKIKSAYEHPVLQPVMQAIALAGLGTHDEGLNNPKGKRFKIIGIPAPIEQKNRNIVSRGYYSNKNSVFALVTDNPVPYDWGSVLHESTHFVMQEVFKNDCNPYHQGDGAQEKCMDTIVTRANLQFTFRKGEADAKEEEALNAIRAVFECYNYTQYNLELIVKVPEVMGLMGPERGYSWLNENVPELVTFYNDHVNPAIRNYLREHKVDDYIQLPSAEQSTLIPPAEHRLVVASKAGDTVAVQELLKTREIFEEVLSHAYKEAHEAGQRETLSVLTEHIHHLSPESKGLLLNYSVKTDNAPLMEKLLQEETAEISLDHKRNALKNAGMLGHQHHALRLLTDCGPLLSAEGTLNKDLWQVEKHTTYRKQWQETVATYKSQQEEPQQVDTVEVAEILLKEQEKSPPPLVNEPPLDPADVTVIIEKLCQDAGIISKRGKVGVLATEGKVKFEQLPPSEQGSITEKGFAAALKSRYEGFVTQKTSYRGKSYLGIIKDKEIRGEAWRTILYEAASSSKDGSPVR